MASTLDTHTANRPEEPPGETVAVIDETELEAARRDPRVRSFLAEADAYLVEFERQRRDS